MTNTDPIQSMKVAYRASSIQHIPAEPIALYTRTTARCWCQSTITLRADGTWWHGASQGFYCRER